MSASAKQTGLLPPVSRRLRHVAARRLHGLRRGGRELPTYFIVGAKRAGTTSVDEYLIDHPLVLRGLVEKGSRYYDVNYHRGDAWFRSHLPLTRDVDRQEQRLGARPILGESSPYYCFHPEAASRIAADVPDARLIFVLREPAARAWSHYQYEVARGFETLSPEAALAAEEERLNDPDEEQRWYAHRHFSYVGRSRYAEQLRRLQTHFDPEQIHVVHSESVFTDAATAMAAVFDFLGLPPHQQASYASHKPTPGNSGIPESFRDAVHEGVADDLADLRSLLPEPPPWG